MYRWNGFNDLQWCKIMQNTTSFIVYKDFDTTSIYGQPNIETINAIIEARYSKILENYKNLVEFFSDLEK